MPNLRMVKAGGEGLRLHFASGIFWANIRRVVYSLSEEGLYALTGTAHEEYLLLPCREVFAWGQKDIKVVGPLLEDEARIVHEGFWNVSEC